MSTGYFASLQKNHFRTIPDGTKVFYPQGPLGRAGYIVESSHQEAKLKKAILALYIIMFIMTFILNIITMTVLAPIILNNPYLFFLFLIAFSFIGWLLVKLYFYPFTKSMSRTKVANNPIKAWQEMGNTMHPILLHFFLLTSISMCLANLYLYTIFPQYILLFISFFFLVTSYPIFISLKQYYQNKNK